MVESRCGILCSRCKIKKQGDCNGCSHIYNPFWGVCPIKICCENKDYPHCGVCKDFPCSLLKKFDYDKDKGYNGKRIRQCKDWAKNK